MSPFLVDPAAPVGAALVALGRLGGLTAALAVLLLAPGLLLALAVVPRCREGRGACALAAGAYAADALAAAPGLGVLVVTFAWWAADLAGLPMTAPMLALLVALAVAGLAVALAGVRPRPTAAAGWLGLVWLAALVARLAVVRDLALPAWVDALQHTYITGLLLDQARVPDDYGPLLLNAAPFDYHFGFHAVAATAAALTGAAPPDAVLAAGQVLSACAAPAAFLLARLYGASTGGALVAAASAGLVSMMPAYYVSWSRFTQLAGLVAAPAWLLIARRTGLGPTWAVLAGLASAAMLMVHPRVAAMLALLVVVDFALARDRWPGQRRWLPLAPVAALVVAAPWLDRVVNALLPRVATPVAGLEAANQIDPATLGAYHDPWFYGLAAAAVAAGLTANSRGARVAAAWLALTFAVSNPGLLGLPGTYMLSNGSVLISLWLPAAAALGCGAGWAASALARRVSPSAVRRAAPVLPALVLLAGLALADGPLNAAVNPGTVLATPADRRALEEAAHILPADALVAVNVREWQLGIYMGSDAGYWIGVVTPGRAIVPPLLYPLAGPAATQAIGGRLARWRAAGGDPRALADQMRAMGAGWLFVGEKGGAIETTGLTPDAGFDLVLAEGGARLYRLRG